MLLWTFKIARSLATSPAKMLKSDFHNFILEILEVTIHISKMGKQKHECLIVERAWNRLHIVLVHTAINCFFIWDTSLPQMTWHFVNNKRLTNFTHICFPIFLHWAPWTHYIFLKKPLRVIGKFPSIMKWPKSETFANPTYSQDKEVYFSFRCQDKSIKKMKQIKRKRNYPPSTMSFFLS